MRASLRRALPVLVVAGVLLVPATASAHPLGNFTINTSAAIEISPGEVRVRYVVDMAEIPTVQARAELDANGDDEISAVERSTWASATAAGLADGLVLEVDGAATPLVLREASASLLPGQGGLEVLRIDASFVADVGADRATIAFEDANYDGNVGWREVSATAVDGARVLDADVPAASPTGGLRSYPEDLLSSPLDVRTATVTFAPGGVAGDGAAGPEDATSSRPSVAGGALADLVDRTGGLMLLALAIAFGFGAVHAVGPGHGKTLMAAYLVGSGGRTRQAVAIGAAVATMHTASVLILGVVVLGATSVLAPERVYPWLGVASGVVAVALGATLLVRRLGRWSDTGADPRAAHAHGPGQDHAHAHPPVDAPLLSRRGLLGLAVAGGILPSPSALVALLASIAVGRAVYGLALIAAFSAGLASALVLVGIVAMRARDAVRHRMSRPFVRVIPVASASAIVVVGLALTVNGLAQL
ncbi:MAG TPA: sulfite exporter TauE/SafE family protein [Actinomycetota bacterium]|nr:sulfite exporter TauE/SafE family protein [Actinomycetota bacterium]